jgi:hypothetical protein
MVPSLCGHTVVATYEIQIKVIEVLNMIAHSQFQHSPIYVCKRVPATLDGRQ